MDFQEASPAQINPHSENVDPPAQLMIINPHFAVWDRIDEILDRITELGGGGISRHLHPQRLVQWV